MPTLSDNEYAELWNEECTEVINVDEFFAKMLADHKRGKDLYAYHWSWAHWFKVSIPVAVEQCSQHLTELNSRATMKGD